MISGGTLSYVDHVSLDGHHCGVAAKQLTFDKMRYHEKDPLFGRRL